LSAVGLLFGGYFAIEEWFIEPSFATNDAMIWTLPLVAYIFLALSSTGVSIVLTSGELLNHKVIKANKPALLLAAISLLIGAFASLATELGSFLHVFWLLLTPNLSSPIWWMGTLYSIELALLGMKFYALVSQRQFSFERWLSVGTLCVAVCASLVLGSVFGTAIGRAAFSGVDASVLMLLCALASGLCVAPMLISQQQREQLLFPARLVLGVLALFLLVKYVYLARSSVMAEVSWTALWMPVLLLVALVAAKTSSAITTVIAMPVLLLVELSFVIQGQVHVLGPKQSWFGALLQYQPNGAELGILAFGCSVAYLCYFVLSKIVGATESALSESLA